jgi:hypothetical protein
MVGMAYTRTVGSIKKSSANELARLSLYKEVALNKRPNIIYARYQQLYANLNFHLSSTAIWRRLSLFIRAVFDRDIAFRTQERLPFVRGAEIRMRPRRMICIGPPQCWQVGLSSAPKAKYKTDGNAKYPELGVHRF